LSLFNAFNAKRRYFIPEVIQTSAMDCGPATLKAVLEGYDISANYERLREVCQTDVSGTSINTIEDIACHLGLDAEQVIIQNDHLLLPETDALPAIIVVSLPDGTGHFVVVWRMHGQMIQIMDPAIGRIWITQQKLFDMVYPFTQPVNIDIWENYSKSETFCSPLIRRMSDLNIATPEINRLIDHAQNNNWEHMATLDASVRLLHTIYHSGASFHGDDSEKILNTYYELALNEPSKQIIPNEYFSVFPDLNDSQTVFMKGALLVHIAGKADRNNENIDKTDLKEGDKTRSNKSISNILNAAIHDPIQPEKEFYEQVLSKNQMWPFMLILALSLAAINVAIEALLLMGFVDIGFDLSNGIYQQPMTMVSIMIFFVALLCLETPVNAALLNLGRRFEISMRMRFLTKTPALGDHFFRSRLKSDMAQRLHDMRLIREMPEIAGGMYRLIFQMVITVVGIMYLMPTVSIIPIIAGITAVIIPMASIHLLKEQDLKFRTLTGSLAQYCLDALIGIVPLRSHSAENAIRYKFESILCQWKKSGTAYYFVKLAITGSGALVNILLAIWLIFEYISREGSDNCVLLLIYWVLNLSELGAQLSNLTGMYPGLRNRMVRILEPINSQPETELSDENAPTENFDNQNTGMKIELKHTSVFAAERQILDDIHLTIQAGEHIAIVGSSGAGKSSLMKLLLGFYQPDTGQILIDNKLLSPNMNSIRRQTAWIDPSVHIWNRPLSDNIRYGTEEEDQYKYCMIMEQAGLIKVLNSLPDGNNTRLGEGGRLVSGGEGQRVRLGRGMYRNGARLVILDEPFRGLGRTERSQLLQKALNHWHDSTLIFISHDVQDTIHFDRVLVMSHGKIVEDAAPQNLLLKKDSIYRSIVNHEKEIRQSIVNKAQWRKWWIENGKLVEEKRL